MTFFGGLSYLDAEFDSFDAASPLPGDIMSQDLGGQRPHFSPEWQGSLVADWRSPFGNSGPEWFLRPEYMYIGEHNTGANTNNNPQSIQDGYGMFDEDVTIVQIRKMLAAHSLHAAKPGRNLLSLQG